MTMLPELRSQLTDIVTGLVSEGRLVWEGSRVGIGWGWGMWDVLEIASIWNEVSWWPNKLLAQVLDLIQNYHFELAALSSRERRGGELAWVYSRFVELQRELEVHIARFGKPRP